MPTPRPARRSIAMDALSQDTKTRILDAAETLFMEHGFEATSLRQLTGAAGVNLAAVNYHFGTKEELFQAVLTRRLDPMNQERIDLLERYRREAGARPLSCEKPPAPHAAGAHLAPAFRDGRAFLHPGRHRRAQAHGAGGPG
ncbi:MAG: helix-turn-helix transcriptional regulator [Betaproteobacteria bacterium]|nr:helix-turn-helix transcriptional regulator [Betaproteobacteria bacterium]